MAFVALAECGPAAYYRTRATPCNARRAAPRGLLLPSLFFSISSFFPLSSLRFFFAGRTDRRSMAVFRVAAPSPPSRRERFLMTVILARKEGKGERESVCVYVWVREGKPPASQARATDSPRLEWNRGGKQSDSRFQGGCAHQRPLKVAAQCARAPISALSRFLRPFFLFGILVSPSLSRFLFHSIESVRSLHVPLVS